jgi:uncharacterized protein YjiS (DUF1127 family)
MTNQPMTTHRSSGTTATTHGADAQAGIAFKLGAFARRVRARAAEELRCRQALRELRRLDDRDLDDLGLGQADLPGIARRHAHAAVG